MDKEKLSVGRKDARRALFALRETEFLRLKRTRIGRDDFESLKIIGRGAFGEVILNIPRSWKSCIINLHASENVKPSKKIWILMFEFWPFPYQIFDPIDGFYQCYMCKGKFGLYALLTF